MQQDTNKTNAQLLDELRELRQRNIELEASLTNCKKAEEHLCAISETTLDAIIISDQDANIVFWNKAAAKIFGYETEEVLGKPATVLMSDESLEEYNEGKKHILERGFSLLGKKTKESLAKRKDGSLFPVEMGMSSWKSQGKDYYIGSLRDISDQKLTEEMLEKSEEHFRAVSETSLDAIIITDQDGNIVYWNKAATEIFGYEAKEAIDSPVTMLIPQGAEMERYNKAKENVIERGISLFGKTPKELIARRKDGSLFSVETTMTNWKIKDKYYFGGILRDITQRRQEEEALRESEGRFRVIFENAGIGITLVDSKGNFIKVNKSLEEIYGYSAAELSAMSFTEITHPDEVKGNFEIFTELMKGKREYYQIEKRYIGKHDRAIWAMLTVSLLRDSSGSPQYALSMVEDITERKQMEEQLRKSHDELENKVKQRTAELAKANKELQASKDYLKKFSVKILSIREDERKNISRALHDELGSMAVSLTSKISIAKEEVKDNNTTAALKVLEQGEMAIRKAVQDLRKLAVDLRPQGLEIRGLPAALSDYIETIKKLSKIRITFSSDLGNKKPPTDTAIIIYRVAQEGLTNITKHSKAKNAEVRLHADKKNIYIVISDDGIGFDIDKIHVKKGRLKIGIEGMRERIESLGGEFIITSAPKRGTQLKATLPKK